jgi:hypothetical protein
MAEISRVALFGKLNSLCYRAIESSTVFCKLRGNPYVELVALDAPDPAVAGLRPGAHRPPLRTGAGGAGARPDRGARPPAARRDVGHRPVVAARGSGRTRWVYGTLMFGESQVRSGHLVVGMLKTTSLRNACTACRASSSASSWTPVRQFRQPCWRFAGSAAGATDGFGRRRGAGRSIRRHRAGRDGQAGSAERNSPST